MHIEKIFLDEIYRCYSTMAMELDGDLHYFFASEEKGYPCYAYPAHNIHQRKTVWEKGGGTMSMIPLPQSKNQFIAIMDFYLKECPSQAKLVHVTYENGSFIQKDLFYLPFLHRFDLYEVLGKVWFIGATIAHDKKDKEDWSQPGKIYVGELNLMGETKLRVIKEGLTRNHGYTQSPLKDGGYFGCDEGLYKVSIPTQNSDWKVEQVLKGQIGEVALCDVNQDGQFEIMTIEPFHGNQIKIYASKEVVFNYPGNFDFAHTLVGASIHGVPSFIGGIRRETPDLFMVQYEAGSYQTILVDKGVGPANLNVVQYLDKSIIHSANHTQNEAAIYIVE